MEPPFTVPCGVGRQLPVAQVRTTRATVLLLEVRLQIRDVLTSHASCNFKHYHRA